MCDLLALEDSRHAVDAEGGLLLHIGSALARTGSGGSAQADMNTPIIKKGRRLSTLEVRRSISRASSNRSHKSMV